MCKVKIVLNAVPPSLNRFAGRKNSWDYRAEKEKWSKWVQFMCCKNRPPKPFDKAIVSITYRFSDRIRRDPDNYCGKLLLDGLTRGGVIKDDSFRHIELRLRQDAETGEPRTIIEVEQIE